MSMSKKDYVAIAALIKQSLWFDQDKSPIIRARHFTYELANICAANNPRFDRARFLKACGVNNG